VEPGYRVRSKASAWPWVLATALAMASRQASEIRPRAAARRAILAEPSSFFIATRTLRCAFRSLRALDP